MNYAIPGASRYQNVNVNPWMQALQGYSAADISEFNWSPHMGLENFLKTINPSMNTAATIRQMADMINQRWGFDSFQAMQRGEKGPDWTSYLQDFDWGREMNRLTPAVRRESAQRFQRPVRTITF